MHNAEISRANPAAFVLLIDQSGSMADPWGAGTSDPKAKALADAVNNLLYTLVLRASKGEAIYDYFDIALVGYGQTVGSCFQGALSGQEFVPVSKIGMNPLRLEDRIKKVPDGAGGIVETKVKFPIWLEAVAAGGTPMCQALDMVRSLVSKWAPSHPRSFPPIVIHITDGESTDGDPSEIATAIRGITTQDGEVLLLNLHISGKSGEKMAFSDSEDLPDEYAKFLFRISSILPPNMAAEAAKLGYRISPQSRGYMFNAAQVEIVEFLQIGTRPSAVR